MRENPTEDSSFHQHFISGQRFKILIVTILLTVLGYFLFTLWGGWENVVSSIKQVGIKGIIAALSLSLVNYGLRFLRWQYFLSVLGHHIPWKPSLRIYMSGFALTTTPGKTGEALRSVFLKDFGVPFRRSFGAFLAERLSDLLSVTLLASMGLLIYPEARPILLIVLGMLAFIFFAVQRDAWLMWLERMAKKLFPEKHAHIIEFMLETIRSFRSCFSPIVLATSIAFGVVAWCAEALALYYILSLLGQDIGLLTAVFIYGFSLVIGGITLLPGGLGGAEVTMLQLLVINHVPAAIAVAATLVIRLTTLWFSVLLGIIALPKKQILWQKKPDGDQ